MQLATWLARVRYGIPWGPKEDLACRQRAARQYLLRVYVTTGLPAQPTNSLEPLLWPESTSEGSDRYPCANRWSSASLSD